MASSNLLERTRTLPQIGLDMVVGQGPVAGRDADEAHHQRYAAAGMDVDPELMGQPFFVVNVKNSKDF